MPVKNARIGELIAKAVETRKDIEKMTAELDELKAQIRAEAEKRSKDGELVEFESEVGVATVAFYADAPGAIEGANLWELRNLLPRITWEDLFVEKVALAQGFTEKFGELKKKHQVVVREYVKWTPRAPHVILPK